MALVVEDGSGLAGAESYASVAEADAYHTARSNSLWTGADAVKEAALRRATDYMLQTYRSRWHGTRYTLPQALDWPRSGVPIPDSPGGTYGLPAYVAVNAVPAEVKRACIELALDALSGDLNPDLSRATLREKVDVIEVEYDHNAPEYVRRRSVDQLLEPYLCGGSSSVSLVRA